MNRHLRKGKEASERTLAEIGELTEALKKSELPIAITVHRGGSNKLINGATTVEEVLAMAQRGEVVSDNGFMSSSTLTSEAFPGDVVYHVNVRPGKGIGAYVDGISAAGGESEFLFQRTSAFKVTGGYMEGRQLHCTMEYVGNEF